MSDKDGNDAVSSSSGVSDSFGVSYSSGVRGSSGVSDSFGVSYSSGVRGSFGVSDSFGVSSSSGVSDSFGVSSSSGVSYSIFCAKRPRVWRLFEKEVTQDRFNEVWEELHKKLNGWFPKPNNAFKLYDANGKEWKSVDASKIVDQSNKEAWADMPVGAINYLKSLPEFDAEIFKAVTEIDVSVASCAGKIVDIDGKRYRLQEI